MEFTAGDVMFGVFYPRRYIVAAFDERRRAEEALTELAQTLELDDSGRIWESDEALAYYKEHIEEQSTLFDRVVSLLVPNEASALEHYLGLARSGSVFLTVHVEGDDAIERVRKVLAGHGAHSMRYYGDWTVRDLRSGRTERQAQPAG